MQEGTRLRCTKGAKGKKKRRRSFFKFMPLRVAAHKRSSRGTSYESPAPEAFHLWTPPPYFSWRVENTNAT